MEYLGAKILSAAVVGLEAEIIEVEADITRGLPRMPIVGLPDAAVQEAKERVRSGIKNSGIEFPPGVVTVNLAPASLKKEGSGYDLPIAIAVLIKRGEIIPPVNLHKKIFIGELSLNGSLRPINGILPIAVAAKEEGIKEIYLPGDNAAEASLVKGMDVYAVKSLSHLIEHLRGRKMFNKFIKKRKTLPLEVFQADMSQVKGQEHAKRALEIAAAGSHNVLLTGPPGSGKTLLARMTPTILPAMTFEESIDVTKIYSVAGLLSKNVSIINQRPFRSPHHSASSVALVGGGSFPKPGEVSLTHRGVLFLDEFPEFSRSVLESLRQPLEDGEITVARAAGSVKFPAQFTLIAARNPCPCGFYNDPKKQCTCSPQQIIKYHKKLSGPLLDRIDIHVTVPRLEYEKITEIATGESSVNIRRRVNQARKIQTERFRDLSLNVNAEMPIKLIESFCTLDSSARELLKNAVNQFYLSTRAYHRVLKVGRTIADLADKKNITSEHIAEAIQYRPQTS